MRIGGPKALTDAVKAAGGEIGPRLKWLGSWNLKSGIGDWDAFFAGCKAEGVTPEIYWFAWGDFISPAAITNGVSDTQQGGVFKTQANLLPLLSGVMAKAKAAGVQPIVVIEGEFNKAGCEASPVFAAWWDKCEAIVRTVPGAKVVFAMGNWGNIKAVVDYYAPQVAKSDYMGLQAVKFAPRHGVSAISGIGAALSAGFNAMATTKPKVIYDCALSCYGGPYASAPPFAGGDGTALEAVQQTGIQSLAQVAGLEFVVYRDLKDNPNMGLDQYGGWAERFVGIMRTDGTKKPSHDALMSLAKPPPPTTFTRAEMDAVASQRDKAVIERDTVQAELIVALEGTAVLTGQVTVLTAQVASATAEAASWKGRIQAIRDALA